MSIESSNYNEQNMDNISDKDQSLTLTNEQINRKIQEEKIIQLKAREEFGGLERSLSKKEKGFEIDKELMAYKDQVFTKIDNLGVDQKLSKTMIHKLEEVFHDISENKYKFEFLNSIEKVIDAAQSGKEVDHKELQEIINKLEEANPALKGILGLLVALISLATMASVGMATATAGLIFGIATGVLFMSTRISLEGANNESNMKKSMILDTINDIVPEISEIHFKRIEEAQRGTDIEDLPKVLNIIGKELSESYKDRVLTDKEVTKLEEAIKNI